MKKTIVIIAGVSIFFASTAMAGYVQGYHKKDGTYVQGYYRSSPNAIKHDNYGAKGNRSPYTNKKGYSRHEYTDPYSRNIDPNPYNRNNARYHYNRRYEK